jgi:fructokinase
MSTSDEAVVIWGELLWDRFPDGAKLGGAPANVAWHLGQAGGWARLVTRVGNDEDGRRAVDHISAFVDTALIQVDPARPTGEVTVVVANNNEPRYTLQPGRAWEHIACTPEVATAIAEAGVLIYGTLSQRTPDGLAEWERAIAAAGPGCMKVCDVNLRRRADGAMIEDPRVVERALAAADVVKVNDKELATLAAAFGWADPIATLRSKRVLAVTHGAGGSTLYSEGSMIHVAGVQSRAGGDNVGCGDAYVALLVLGMTMGFDLATSGRIASRWAAAVACVRGATPVFTDEEIATMMETDA